MSFDIIYTPEFEKEIKKLSKKYPSLKKDFSSFLTSLQMDPLQGTLLGKKFIQDTIGDFQQKCWQKRRSKNNHLCACC